MLCGVISWVWGFSLLLPFDNPYSFTHMFTNKLYNATLATNSCAIFSRVRDKLHSPKKRLNVLYAVSTLIVSLLQSNPLIELITLGLVYLAAYIAGVIALRILTPTDLNYMENIFSSLGPFSEIFTQ